MRLLITAIALLALAAGAVDAADGDSHWDGRVKVGGVWLDQTGDETTMPETFNIYDGFTVSSIYLNGYSSQRNHLLLDLSNINQDNRKGVLDYRYTGMVRFQSRYTESRWVFDPTGAVDANRKDFWSSLSLTPSKSLWFKANYGVQARDGNRIGLTPGYEGWLGSEYDSKLHRYRLEAQARAGNGIGGTLAYDGVMQRDAIDPMRERDGYVASALVHVPGYYFKRLTHVVRGAIGRSEIRETGVGFDMKTLQYTGVLRGTDWFKLRYRFNGSTVDDEATLLTTDNFRQDIDGTFDYRISTLMLGYGWEALDDERAVTTTNRFRGSLALRGPNNKVSGRVAYDAQNRDDTERTTLIQDVESDRWDVRVDARPSQPVSVGARYTDRSRELTDLGTKADGTAVNAYASWTKDVSYDLVTFKQAGVEYTYTDEEYDNLWGIEHIATSVVTGRLGISLFEDLDVTGSFTYLSAGKDLDLDKSIISVGAGYHFGNGLLADVQYNVYNYDDYLILSRYYTANVIWFNVGYAFSAE